MILEITMYRAVCDEPGCEASLQDGDVYAYSDPESCLLEAQDTDWTVKPDLLLCTDHNADVCMDDDCPRRDTTEAEDGWRYCTEHIDQGTFDPTP